jgi:hypothetical protein
MSPSNVELLIRAFAGWGKDNPANMRDILHPDCELSVPDSVHYGGTLQGIDAVIGWFTRELWQRKRSGSRRGACPRGSPIVPKMSSAVCAGSRQGRRVSTS